MEKPSSKPAWTSANVAEPSNTLRSQGWAANEKPYAEHFNWLVKNLSEWVEYLEEKTDALTAELEAERLRALAAEQALSNQTYTETIRATAQETLLNSRLSVIEAMADAKLLAGDTTEIEAALAAEVARAQAAEQAIGEDVTALEQAIADEQARAELAESGLQASISAENVRAVIAEQGIVTSLEAEVARSTEKDTEHSGRLAIVEARIDSA